MPNPSLRLAELLASRLCHDLITPIGALNTGLELFQETSSTHSTDSEEILNLILHSSQTASARVSFFRIAFGSSGKYCSLGEARKLMKSYFDKSKVDFQWNDPFQEDLALERWGQLILNMALWVSECAPRGGHINISSPTNQNLHLSFKLKAESIIFHKGTLEALEGKAVLEDLTPRTITCYLIHSLTEEINAQIVLEHTVPSSEFLLKVLTKKP